MSDLKPIEAGCMAVTYNCIIKSNNWKFVRVGKCLGEVDGFVGLVRWEVDQIMKTTKGLTCNHLMESRLIRIDDPDLKKEPITIGIEFIGDLMEEAISNLNALIK